MISIIVPIYDVELYLEKCIESLVKQTYSNIEIILVDDGSPDRCGEICDEFAVRDKRIVVIHQTNQGVSAARNAGLNVAHGDYIGFCDPDDYVSADMYQRLYTELKASNAQIAVCDCIVEFPDGKTLIPDRRAIQILNQKEAFSCFWDTPATIKHSIWNKLFKREICSDIRFNTSLNSAEDAEFLGRCLLKINKMVYVHEPLYFNYRRSGSAQRGLLKSDSVIPCLSVYKMLWDNYQLIDNDNEMHVQSFYLTRCYRQYLSYCKDDLSGNKAIIREIRRCMRQQFPVAFANKEITWKARIVYFLFAIGMRK